MKAGLLAVLILMMAVGLAACSSSQHDTVVGVARVCMNGTATVYLPGACTSAPHTELTVRTPKGTTYTVNLNGTASVKVGDRWPPE